MSRGCSPGNGRPRILQPSGLGCRIAITVVALFTYLLQTAWSSGNRARADLVSFLPYFCFVAQNRAFNVAQLSVFFAISNLNLNMYSLSSSLSRVYFSFSHEVYRLAPNHHQRLIPAHGPCLKAITVVACRVRENPKLLNSKAKTSSLSQIAISVSKWLCLSPRTRTGTYGARQQRLHVRSQRRKDVAF
jgi:hypothetical protein